MLHGRSSSPCPFSTFSFFSSDCSSPFPLSPGRLPLTSELCVVVNGCDGERPYPQNGACSMSHSADFDYSSGSSPEESPTQSIQTSHSFPATNSQMDAAGKSGNKSTKLQPLRQINTEQQTPLHLFERNSDTATTHLYPPRSHVTHTLLPVIEPVPQPVPLPSPSVECPSALCASSSDDSNCSTSSDSAVPASTPALASDSGASSSGRKRASVSTELQRERARKRLENHKRYDRRRAVILSGIHKDLREVIQSSQQLIQRSRQEHFHRSEDDDETKGKEDVEENSIMQLPGRMELDTLSHSELFLTAAKAIRSLHMLKSKLEARIEALSENDDDDAHFQHVANPADNSIFLATSEQLQQLNLLLSAMQSASRLYADQLQTFQSLLTSDSHHAISAASMLPIHAVSGLTGRHFTSILRREVLVEHLSPNELTYLDMWGDNSDVYRDVDCPQLLQTYAMCALLSKNFSQHLSESQQRFHPTADQVLDFVQQSVRAQLHSSYQPTAQLSASPLAFRHGDEHPLNQYSISPQCYQIVGDVLNSLSNLSESEYNSQVDLVLPLLRSPIPLERVRAPQVARISRLDRRDRTVMEFMFSKYFTPTYSQLTALADLWSGRKSMVHFSGLTQPSPSDKMLQADCDCTFLLNPITGEKVGLICFLRRLYFSQPMQQFYDNFPNTDSLTMQPHTSEQRLGEFAAATASAASSTNAFASIYSSAASSSSSSATVHSSAATSASRFMAPSFQF